MRLKNIFLLSSSLILTKADNTYQTPIEIKPRHFLELKKEERHLVYLRVSEDKHYFVYIIKSGILITSMFTYWYPMFFDRNNSIVNYFLSLFKKEDFVRREKNLEYYKEYLKGEKDKTKQKDATNIFEIGETFQWNLTEAWFIDFFPSYQKQIQQEGRNIALGTEQLREEFNNNRIASATISSITIISTTVLFTYSHVFNWSSFGSNLFYNLLSTFPALISVFQNKTSNYDKTIIIVNNFWILVALNLTCLMNHNIIHNKAVQLTPEKVEQYLTI